MRSYKKLICGGPKRLDKIYITKERAGKPFSSFPALSLEKNADKRNILLSVLCSVKNISRQLLYLARSNPVY